VSNLRYAEAARPRVLIIGLGHSGLCLGIALKKAGIHSFTILEKCERLGGTWRDNVYPGAACDSPAFAYCFSFEQKTDWSRKWAFQSEILDYMQLCAEKYGLLPHTHFGREVASARFDEEAGVWRVRTVSGNEYEAEYLISSVGQLNRPSVPAIPGLERFQGAKFHSARWDHDVNLTGKTVACIGNAASAIQFVPEIAKQLEKLHIFQRSANWMMPKFDREFSESEKRRFTRVPLLAKLYRCWIWLSFELTWPIFRGVRWMSKRLERLAVREMRKVIKDPELQEALIPDYPIGGKRILISDDYYQTLNRENVEVVLDEIDHLTEDAVVTKNGTEVHVDVVILATGFESTSFLAPMHLEGLARRSLQKEWENGAQAYLGMTHPGFPNFFMTYGPNTNLGHNSILFMIECQTRYILDCIRQATKRRLRFIDLRQDVLDRYNRDIQRELAGTVWTATDHSWYKNDAGRITNNWSGPTIRYWWKTRNADLRMYHLAKRG